MTVEQITDVANYSISIDFFDSYKQFETYVTLAYLKNGKEVVDFILNEGKGSIWYQSINGKAYMFLHTVANAMINLKFKEAKND